MIKVKTMEEAWTKASEIFPTDYMKDDKSSERAGYPIYRSTAKGHFNDYICDLNDRLEVNIAEGNQSINIWLETEERGEDIEVTAIAKSGETRNYATYAEFKKEFRFFLSSGNRYADAEAHFEKIINGLREINKNNIKIETCRDGLKIIFTYKKWRS